MIEAKMDWTGFDESFFELNGLQIRARVSEGSPAGRPVLVLLHGFPQTHVMWRRVALELREDFFLVMPDLRGYGDSRSPATESDHSQLSKRAMAADIIALLDHLQISSFMLCGHDRGGRVAHRLALDFPDRVESLCLLDIAPTLDMYERSGMDFARAYYHWFFLIQPAPLPEQLIGADPVFYLRHKLGGWGAGGLRHIENSALADYERCYRRPEVIHQSCEDYRASAGIDLEHDRESRGKGEKIQCDTLVLLGEKGVVHRLFPAEQLWLAQCRSLQFAVLPCGHYLAEEQPVITAEKLRQFFA